VLDRERERERICVEREAASADRERSAILMAERAAAAEAEALERCGQLEKECEALGAQVGALRRQLADATADRRGPSQGTQFQQFVAQKREIARLRATVVSLTRTDGRAGSAAAAALPISGGGSLHGGSVGWPLTSPFTPSFTPSFTHAMGATGPSFRSGSRPGAQNSVGSANGRSSTNGSKSPRPDEAEGGGGSDAAGLPASDTPDSSQASATVASASVVQTASVLSIVQSPLMSFWVRNI